MKYIASIIIPAYNEEKNIGCVVRDLKKSLGKEYQIIVVDDGSSDNTYEISTNNGAQCIKLPKNSGKGHACMKGIEKAKSDNIIFFDADAQFTPSDVKKIVKKLKNNDIVLGTRDFSALPLQRMISNKFARTVVNSITGHNYKDVLCGLRAAKKESLKKLNIKSKRYEFEAEMLINASLQGLRISEVPVNVDYSGYRGMPRTQSMKVTLYLVMQWLKNKVKV